jgi:hypothetical protein
LTKLLLGAIIIVLEIMATFGATIPPNDENIIGQPLHLLIFNLSFMGMSELVTIVQQHIFQMLEQPILSHDVNSYGLCICHISH